VTWSRRTLLRSAGAAGLLFPYLRAGAARAAAPATPRLVLLMQSNGTLQSHFWPAPEAGLLSPILTPLVKDPAIAAKTTLVRGLVNDVGGAGNGHDHGFCGLYSGYASVGSFNDPWGSGISLDQQLRQTLTFSEPYPTLNCGVLASDTPPFKAHRRSFSYRAAGQQIPTEVDPYRLYARFFGGTAAAGAGNAGGDATAAARRRLRGGRTVLDFAREDIRALQTRLGRLDRDKLEAHATALREMEQRLAATLEPALARPAQCGGVAAPAAGLNVRAEDDAPALMRAMFDLVALAISCQLTRIVTFPMGHGGEKWYFRWLGINQNSHDDIAHRDNGSDPAVTEKLLQMNVWYAEQVAHLCQALERLPDGEAGGSTLDRTLVVWGNEIANGPHAMADIPVVLIGRAAGRLRTGGTVVNAGPQDYRRLGTSLQHVMGVPATGFGQAPECGPLVGLDAG
jgi:hypothetical protein